jgi:hypothetical protein
MSIFVEFDDLNFEVTNLARHDHLTDRERKKIGTGSSWDALFSGVAPTRGRSVAHSKRYAGNTENLPDDRTLPQ